MKTPFLLAAGAALLTGGLLPVQFQAERGSAPADPRTPIDAVHTPGDADSLYRISEPGSYYLPGPVQGEAGKRGIEITSSGVTIDLMGFSLTGVPDSLEGIAAIAIKPRRSVTIENGHVSRWGGDGIDLTMAELVHLRGIAAFNNGGHGIELGVAATVVDCSAQANSHSGMYGLELVRYSNCVTLGNGEDGMVVEQSGSFDGCMASKNENGISGWFGSTAENSVAYDNQQRGFYADVVRGCASTENYIGITALCVASQSAARGSLHDGVQASGVVESVASLQNGGEGIETRNQGALMRGNWAYGNQQSGIRVDHGSTAEHNVSRFNGHGLRSDGRCLVRDNFVNDSAGLDYWWAQGATLRGTEQDLSTGPLLDWHPGVNVLD